MSKNIIKQILCIFLLLLFPFFLTGCYTSKAKVQMPYGLWQTIENNNYSIILNIDPTFGSVDFVGTYETQNRKYDLMFSIHQGFNDDLGSISDIKVKSESEQTFHEIESLHSWEIKSIEENRLVIIVDKLSRDILKSDKIIFNKIENYNLSSSVVE